MSNSQAKLLSDLAKKLKSEPKNKAKIVATLQSANILTKSGKFSKHYANLGKAVTATSK